MKKYLFIFAGVLILLVIVFLLQSYLRANFDLFTKTATVEIAGKSIKLEVADTPEKREIGLSAKRSLPEDRGMLFIFEEPSIYTFWMKDMDFPIDIIFLRNNRIVTIHESVPAPKDDVQDLKLYPPSEAADRVIELNAGKAKEYGLKMGQELEIKL